MPGAPHPNRHTRVARYEAGASIAEIAREDGVGDEAVRVYLHRHGAKIRRTGRPVGALDRAEIAERARIGRLAGLAKGTEASQSPESRKRQRASMFEVMNGLPRGAGRRYLDVVADPKRTKLFRKLRANGVPVAAALAEALR